MRIESKYHLDSGTAALLRDELCVSGFVADSHAHGPDGYTVSTLYLDTPALTGYEEKLDGLTRRVKYRLRFYGDTPGERVRFEHKEKDGPFSWKRVESARWEDVQVLVRHFAGPLLERLDPRSGYVEPSLWVQYERLAFEHPLFRARINFDADLRWRDVDLSRETLAGHAVHAPLAPGQVICEIKVPREYARDVAELVRRWNLHWRATSKYAICIAHRERCLRT